jgi:cytochrome c
MKKTILVMTSLAVLVACGGGGEKTKEGETKKEETTTADITTHPDYQKGIDVVAKSDCMTCHLINEKNIGPAWVDVANKYAGQDTAVAYLAKKIIDGGAGVWGEVPMAPHPAFTQADAEAVAKYVLLLKSK